MANFTIFRRGSESSVSKVCCAFTAKAIVIFWSHIPVQHSFGHVSCRLDKETIFESFYSNGAKKVLGETGSCGFAPGSTPLSRKNRCSGPEITLQGRVPIAVISQLDERARAGNRFWLAVGFGFAAAASRISIAR